MRIQPQRYKALVSLWFLFIILGGCAKKPPVARPILAPQTSLRQNLDQIFSDSTFHNAFWGILVQSIDNGELLYKSNADKLLMPASTMKVVTAVAALSYQI